MPRIFYFFIFIFIILTAHFNHLIETLPKTVTLFICVVLFLLYSYLYFRFSRRIMDYVLTWEKRNFYYSVSLIMVVSVFLVFSIGIPTTDKAPFITMLSVIGDFLWYTLFQLVCIWRIDLIKISNKNHLFYKRSWMLYSMIPLLIWTMYLLAFFPGLMSVDSITQWRQVIEFSFNDTHPAFHTLIIWLITQIWFSPAAVVVVQLIFQAVIVGYGVYTIEKYGASKKIIWAITLFYALSPGYGMLGVSIWKDTPYSVSLFWLLILLVKVALTKGEWLEKRKHLLLFMLVLLLVFMLRHNGILPAAGVLFVLLVSYRKYLKRVLLIVFGLIIIIFTIKVPLYQALKVSPSSSGNLVWGLPLMQVSGIVYERSFKYQKLLGNEEWSFQADYDGYKLVAMPIKDGIDLTELVKNNKGDFGNAAGEYTGPYQSTLYKNMLYLTVSDYDTGWKEDETPSSIQIKEYINNHTFSIEYQSTDLDMTGIEEAYQYLSNLIPNETWIANYNPYYSYILLHPKFNDVYFQENKSEFIKIWIQLIAKYPVEALKSWGKLSSVIWEIGHPDKGYIYPFEWEIVPNDLGLKTTPISFGLQEKIKSILLLSLKSPAISVFWRPALFVFISLLSIVLLRKKLKGHIWLLLTPLLLEIVGLFATVPAQDTRYLYSFMLIAPYLVGLLFSNQWLDNNNDNERDG